MKAVIINKFVGNLSELKLTDTPLPKPSNPKDVLVKITHAAVTHVDQLYAQGLHQNNKRHIQPPFILGTEFSGTVISSPSPNFQPGDRVFGGSLGSYAEYTYAAPEGLKKVHKEWSNAEACAIGSSGAISYGALQAANLKAGETVLILGASGGLGVMAVQIAAALGARVIAVAGSEEKAAILRRLCAGVQVIKYTDKDWENAVRALTDGGEGVDVVYDGIGAVQSSIKCLRYRGRVVIVGFAGRGREMEEVGMNRILLKSATVCGYRFGEDGRRDWRRTVEAWMGFMKLVEGGCIRPVLYDGMYGLEEVGQALLDVKTRKVWGRMVLKVGNEEFEKARL